MGPTEEQLDVLRELVNIGVGRAAGELNEMLNTPIRLFVTELVFMENGDARTSQKLADRARATVHMGFGGAFDGIAALVFPADDALRLVALLTDESEECTLDTLRQGTLTEVGNIVLNGLMGSLANSLKQPLSYRVPNYTEDTLENIIELAGETTTLLALATFSVEELSIEGAMTVVFTVSSFAKLIRSIDTAIGVVA